MRRLIFGLGLAALYCVAIWALNRDPMWREFVPAIVMSSLLLCLVLVLMFRAIRRQSSQFGRSSYRR